MALTRVKIIYPPNRRVGQDQGVAAQQENQCRERLGLLKIAGCPNPQGKRKMDAKKWIVGEASRRVFVRKLGDGFITCGGAHY